MPTASAMAGAHRDHLFVASSLNNQNTVPCVLRSNRLP